jgi:hypothetical protein
MLFVLSVSYVEKSNENAHEETGKNSNDDKDYTLDSPDI